MVEDRITDGKRTAQLLASELTGLSSGVMDRLGVEDADPDAEPSDDGTFAYGIVRDDERVGEVFVHETTARIDLSAEHGSVAELDDTDTEGLSVTTTDDGSLRVHVEYGAAVKRAVDLLVTTVEER